MSEETKVSEKTAVRDAFEWQIRVMYGVLLDNIIQDHADVDDACQKFRKGLSLARKAFELANNMIAE